MNQSTPESLLFGVIAVELGLIDARTLVEAYSTWDARRAPDFSDLLERRGDLTAEGRRLVERHLRRISTHEDGPSPVTVSSPELVSVLAASGSEETQAELSFATVAPSTASRRPGTDVGPGTDVAPGPSWPRYSMIRVHAKGGLGTVWLARDCQLNREVALKEINHAVADQPEMRDRFLHEAQITGQLEHPNIVPVYELARRPTDGQPFYTMRFVRGRTFREAIAEHHARRKEGSPDLVNQVCLLQTFVSVCQTVGYAHSRGVIHRDLKPENVILGAFGEAIVLDWGLAKLIDRDDPTPESDDFAGLAEPAVALSGDAAAGASMVGQQLGTPAYMAPEQAEGRTDQIDTRTDVYGLGAILFEILTGRPPHQGETSVEVLKRIAESKASPRAKETGIPVPPALDAVCARAMARDPGQRYPHVSELAEDVQRWLANEPVSAYPEWFGRRLWRYGRNHPWVVRAIGLVTALLISVFLLSFVVVASIALIWVPLGGLIGTLVGLFQGGARQGARNGAAFGFRVGLILGVITFLALLAFELVAKLWLHY
ncbi:MAG: protein kinase [Isosphaeraceae bacterium]